MHGRWQLQSKLLPCVSLHLRGFGLRVRECWSCTGIFDKSLGPPSSIFQTLPGTVLQGCTGRSAGSCLPFPNLAFMPAYFAWNIGHACEKFERCSNHYNYLANGLEVLCRRCRVENFTKDLHLRTSTSCRCGNCATTEDSSKIWIP